jgi:hypothetical protein
MKLPTDCPCATKPPPRDSDETIACCRIQGRYWLFHEEKEPLCRTMQTEAEACPYLEQQLRGDAGVCIGRQGDEISLRWVYRRFRPRGADDAPPVGR